MKFRFFGPAVAFWIGLVGLLPFYVLLAAAAVGWSARLFTPINALAAYGAVTLAFAGAIWWGLAVHATRTMPLRGLFVGGVLAALVGWGALLLPTRGALSLLLAGMLAQFMADYVLAHKAPGLYPAWLFNLRAFWTIGVCLALVLASAMVP